MCKRGTIRKGSRFIKESCELKKKRTKLKQQMNFIEFSRRRNTMSSSTGRPNF